MNTLLYIHPHSKNKIDELLNIVTFWKKSTNGKTFLITHCYNEEILKKIKDWNIDKIFFIECNNNKCNVENILFGIRKIILIEKIDCISVGNSIFEKELAPFIASSLDFNYIPNIINFNFHGDNIICNRFLYGTKAIEKISSQTNKLVISISPNIYKIDERTYKSYIPKISKIKIKKNDNKNFEIIQSTKKIIKRNSLETAKIIIGVGKGIQSKENIKIVEELAYLLGATIGATRSVVDNKWRPEYEKIGQTGKIVKPELYLGFGISGAMQHMTGVWQSRHIIMVNNNPTAECFNNSDLGIVSDLLKIIPTLNSLLISKKNK